MIIVARTLSESEKEEIASKEVIQLSDLDSGEDQQTYRNRLFEWIDGMDNLTFNGQTPFEYFKIEDRSYWLHIRAKLFYELFNDAQILDRIADNIDLGKISEVYCKNNQKPFWERWSPQAKIFGEESDNVPASSKIDFSILYKRLWDMRKSYKAYRRFRSLPEKRPIGFSHSNNNIDKSGYLWDKQIGPLLDAVENKWLRIEYLPIPSVKFKARKTGHINQKRIHPTITTDALAFRYLLTHPTAILKLKKNLDALKQKIGKPLEHDFDFRYHNEIWLKHLHQLIKSVVPSIAFFHFLNEVFRWFFGKYRPPFVVVSGENNNIGRTFADSAKELNIQTFGIQHGIISPHNIDYRFTLKESKVAPPDHFFVWGETTHDYLIKQSNYKPNRIHVVGQLFSDTRKEPVPDSSILEYRKRRNKPVLFFASQQQQNPLSRSETARALARFCKQNHLCCALKYHPTEKRDNLHRQCFAEEDIEDDFTVVDGDLYDIIVASDYGSTCYSTVAWEVMLLKKPVIIIDPLNINLLKLRNEPSVFHTVNQQSFGNWQNNLNTHIEKNYQMALKIFGPRDGKVAKRILETTENII